MTLPFRLTTPDLFAFLGVGTVSTIDGFVQVENHWTILAIAATGIVTYLLGRASNRKLLAEADQIKQETNSLILQNTNDILDLKEREVEAYRNRLEGQALEYKAMNVDLSQKIGRLELHIEDLKSTVGRLTTENKRLTNLLTRRLRKLFISIDDGAVQLVLHPTDADTSVAEVMENAGAPDSGEAV